MRPRKKRLIPRDSESQSTRSEATLAIPARIHSFIIV